MSNGYRDIFTGRYSYGPPKVQKRQTITERLRSYRTDGDFGGPEEHPICEEAADTIEALVAALEKARASVADEWGEDHPEVKEIDAALALARGEK